MDTIPTWRWKFMWGLAVAIFVVCKAITWRATGRSFNARSLGYLIGWPGLDAVAFLGPKIPERPKRSEWVFAWSKLTLGLVILFGLARWIPERLPYLVGWVGMIGIVLILHFGLFHVLSCGWRQVGVDAQPLMNWPILAISLSDFWGRRWNTAFRDLTHRFLFRPLSSRFGPRGAMFTGFAFSGLVHDVVISIPAGGGYGGPSVFFVVQAVGILAERSRTGRKLGLGSSWQGRVFALGFLVSPAVILFHRPFVEGIVVPFIRAIGAIR